MTPSYEIRFDNQVVIVINGDTGLGRVLAILYGLRGAQVVVHAECRDDYQKTSSVDLVVDDILRNGGKAVSNYDPISSPEKIVQCAIDNFGGIDALVCEYGANDRIAYASENWEETTEACFYQVQRLVLECWPHFKRQQYGRIVLATNGDGIVGPSIKPAYVAAKMGIVGLCQSLSRLGRSDNIFCNAYVIGPTMLLTRKDTPSYPDHGPDAYARFAPFVLFLTAERCSETGSLFEIGPRNYLKIEKDLFVPDVPPDFILNVKPAKETEAAIKSRPLEGLVVFVTGAESILGLAIAEHLKGNGASVVAYKGVPLKSQDSNFPRFSMASEVSSGGLGRLRRSSVNVLLKMKSILKESKSSSDEIRFVTNSTPEMALDSTIQEKGRIDILVNCCSLFNEPPSKDINPKSWDLLFKHTISSAFNLSKKVTPMMSIKKRGRIFNVVSSSNQAGVDVVQASLRGLAKAFKGDNISVTTIIGTDHSPLSIQRISSLVSFLSADTTLSGTTLEVSEELLYQVDFKHTMGFRIPSIEEDNLPENIFKRWWQISNPNTTELISERPLSITSTKVINKIKRLSLCG